MIFRQRCSHVDSTKAIVEKWLRKDENESMAQYLLFLNNSESLSARHGSSSLLRQQLEHFFSPNDQKTPLDTLVVGVAFEGNHRWVNVYSININSEEHQSLNIIKYFEFHPSKAWYLFPRFL